MADAMDSKSIVLTGVWVQIPPPAPSIQLSQTSRLTFLFIIWTVICRAVRD